MFIDVKTSIGVVRGRTLHVLDTNVDQFVGIPYAEPPVGKHRFAKPQPIAKPFPLFIFCYPFIATKINSLTKQYLFGVPIIINAPVVELTFWPTVRLARNHILSQSPTQGNQETITHSGVIRGQLPAPGIHIKLPDQDVCIAHARATHHRSSLLHTSGHNLVNLYIIDATKAKNSCMQPNNVMPVIAGTGMSEDCLVLNIWTTNTTALKPVMFWIHGGALSVGSIFQTWFNGSALATKDVVIVSANAAHTPAVGRTLAAADARQRASRAPDGRRVAAKLGTIGDRLLPSTTLFAKTTFVVIETRLVVREKSANATRRDLSTHVTLATGTGGALRAEQTRLAAVVGRRPLPPVLVVALASGSAHAVNSCRFSHALLAIWHSLLYVFPSAEQITVSLNNHSKRETFVLELLCEFAKNDKSAPLRPMRHWPNANPMSTEVDNCVDFWNSRQMAFLFAKLSQRLHLRSILDSRDSKDPFIYSVFLCVGYKFP
ncbi:unnamed protein product [Medioppia subpectinata]|uniref:Carboxylesterase type B domain-containing protein n=1 Tax=Medioppia subpectinata TaxID=1979941 RepID=A0A7R9KXN1_9ACAR|nr:unnamed protein product [Medioppia subpectinata]CAG2111401.1 unnamed protein product [Medioppia subpectinata]